MRTSAPTRKTTLGDGKGFLISFGLRTGAEGKRSFPGSFFAYFFLEKSRFIRSPELWMSWSMDWYNTG